MEILCLISFVSVAALWFFTNEYTTLFGVYEPTFVVRRAYFNVIISVFLCVSLWMSGNGAIKDFIESSIGPVSADMGTSLIILLAALIVLSILRSFSIKGSSCYAITGALAAFAIKSGSTEAVVLWKMALSAIVAPLLAFALSAAIRITLKAIFRRISIHLFTLSYYMRHAVILCIILTAFAIGLNWGGFLCGIGGILATGSHSSLIMIIAIVSAVMIGFMHFRRKDNDEPTGIFADFSIYTVISTGFSVALVMLFFSFTGTTSLTGLCPVPLSGTSLVMAAVAGAGLVQRSILIEKEEYYKEIIGLIASPVGAVALADVLLHIVNLDAANQMIDFTIIAACVVILIIIYLSAYVRRQQRRYEDADRLVNSQQQQIYENSRALTDMELKVVLSENQALHNAVEMKKQEVMNVALSIVEQREYLESLSTLAKQAAKTDDPKEKDHLIYELNSSLKQRLSYDRDVDSQYFYAQAESLHEDFHAKLSESFPNLTQQEKRLATLLRLGFSSKYIATLMNITPKSVEINRYRLRQKLGLGKGDNLVNFIKSI